MFTFALPILFYWILLYPMGCFLYMLYNKTKLDHIEMKIRMGYYLNGYKKEYFYWYLLYNNF